MKLKNTLMFIAFGAGLLVWTTAPLASASTSATHAARTISAPVVNSATQGSVIADIAFWSLCNLTSSGQVFGCAEDNNGGLDSAVRLGTNFLIQFTYNNTTAQIQQEGTNLCLEYNASSATYPVRMDTCTASRTSQWWIEGPDGADQLMNVYADTCLEGSETSGVANGAPLTMASCAKKYAGENWVAVPMD
jgi:hypothetical protein